MKVYYEDKKCNEIQTVVTRAFENEGKNYIQFKDHLYYPQGGGQKGDKGEIEIDGIIYPIINSVKDENGNSISIVEADLSHLAGKEVICRLNREYRNLQMKLHSCLHTHHMVMEKVAGKVLDYPTLSTIEDGFAINKYKEESFDLSLMEEVNQQFYALLETNTPITTYPDEKDENYRYWKCNDMVIPCGGIHVDFLNEIGKVEVTVKRKKKMITVRIELK